MTSKYTESNIFKDSRVNTLLDRIYYEVAKELPEVYLGECLCLSGRAAAQLQGEDPQECNNIILVTSNQDIFYFLKEKLSGILKGSGGVSLKDRALLYYPEAYIEVWKWTDAEPLIIEKHSLIEVQKLVQINEILL